MSRYALAVITILCSCFMGCASTDATPESASRDDCFYIRSVNSWDAIDDKHIYIKEGVNDHYLLTMFSSCRGIKHAQAIALSNTMGRICPNDFGRVTYRDAGMRTSCRIDNVERAASKEKAEALVESRKAEDEEK